jgi:hypothetical protein
MLITFQKKKQKEKFHEVAQMTKKIPEVQKIYLKITLKLEFKCSVFIESRLK